MELSVDRVTSSVDRIIKTAGLFLKRKDKTKPKKDKRVEQVKITMGGFVCFRSGTGGDKKIAHINEALAMMTEEERKEFHSHGKAQKGSREKQDGKGKGGRGAKGGDEKMDV